MDRRTYHIPISLLFCLAMHVGCNAPAPKLDPFALQGPQRVPAPPTGAVGKAPAYYGPSASPAGAARVASPLTPKPLSGQPASRSAPIDAGAPSFSSSASVSPPASPQTGGFQPVQSTGFQSAPGQFSAPATSPAGSTSSPAPAAGVDGSSQFGSPPASIPPLGSTSSVDTDLRIVSPEAWQAPEELSASQSGQRSAGHGNTASDLSMTTSTENSSVVAFPTSESIGTPLNPYEPRPLAPPTLVAMHSPAMSYSALASSPPVSRSPRVRGFRGHTGRQLLKVPLEVAMLVDPNAASRTR